MSKNVPSDLTQVCDTFNTQSAHYIFFYTEQLVTLHAYLEIRDVVFNQHSSTSEPLRILHAKAL